MEDSAINNSSSRNTGGAERRTHDDDDEEEEEEEDVLVPEESGWTVYFDDFFSNNREIGLQNNVSPSSSSGFSGSPSLVSDAASIAAWNKLSSNVIGQSPMVRTDKVTSKKLRLLKKKKKGIVRGGGGGGGGGVMDIDDALEDTASSPVNSPKVSDHHMKHFDHLMNTPRRNDDHTSCSSTSLRNKQMGGGVSAGHFSEMQRDERNDHFSHHSFLGGGGGGGENECTELKKKGLCLVPMSMLVNYFG